MAGMESAQRLLAVAKTRADATASAWLEQALSHGKPLSRDAFFGHYAGAGRRLGKTPPAWSEAERAQLCELGLAVPEVWSLADLGRAALLLSTLDGLAAGEHVALATEIFRKGDNAERTALLRALALLPAPERFAELAAEACRSHVVDVFAALACDNAFPARHLSQAAFNQLVMKTLFLELPLSRIVAWRERRDADLLRMASDYQAERRAAGRSISSDLVMLGTTE